MVWNVHHDRGISMPACGIFGAHPSSIAGSVHTCAVRYFCSGSSFERGRTVQDRVQKRSPPHSRRGGKPGWSCGRARCAQLLYPPLAVVRAVEAASFAASFTRSLAALAVSFALLARSFPSPFNFSLSSSPSFIIPARRSLSLAPFFASFLRVSAPEAGARRRPMAAPAARAVRAMAMVLLVDMVWVAFGGCVRHHAPQACATGPCRSSLPRAARRWETTPSVLLRERSYRSLPVPCATGENPPHSLAISRSLLRMHPDATGGARACSLAARCLHVTCAVATEPCNFRSSATALQHCSSSLYCSASRACIHRPHNDGSSEVMRWSWAISPMGCSIPRSGR